MSAANQESDSHVEKPKKPLIRSRSPPMGLLMSVLSMQEKAARFSRPNQQLRFTPTGFATILNSLVDDDTTTNSGNTSDDEMVLEQIYASIANPEADRGEEVQNHEIMDEFQDDDQEEITSQVQYESQSSNTEEENLFPEVMVDEQLPASAQL
eukprot:TRINITY_DN1209_c0_g1_i1.p1 TRINITY_DN1209_c0_g1~~TRINITY_DN1209_c0_g1_i1.p1  ORF type:complete len:153 (-),score=44.69 TRINITY_DN1209_c0_g1_i1:281-739(-)